MDPGGGQSPPPKKKCINFFLGGGFGPSLKSIQGLGVFLGLVDSSLTGSRSTAYQNRPGFSVLKQIA